MSFAHSLSTAAFRADKPASDPIKRAILAAYAVYLALLGAGWWATVHILPDDISLTLAGHHLHMSEVHRRLLTRAFELGGIVPGVIMLELALVGWAKSSLRHLLIERSPSAMTDVSILTLWNTHIMTWLMTAATFGATLTTGLWLRTWLVGATGINLSLSQLPYLAEIPVLYLLYTLVDYWTHRLDHSHVFWPIHRFHHAATEFTVLNSCRTHPAIFTGVIFTTVPLTMLGASVQAMVDINLLIVGLRFLIHSRIDSNFGWIGRTVFQSPTHHRLHHILDMSEPTGHFSLMPLWDRLFGTWRGEADQTLAVGVSAPYRHGLWVVPDMLRDYGDLLLRLWGMVTGRKLALVHDGVTPS